MSRETVLNDAGHTIKTQIKQRRTNARPLSMLISPAAKRSREFFSTRHFMTRLTSRNKSRFVLVKRDAAAYVFISYPGGWRGGGDTPHMKGVGILVVSLRGVNFGFWSHLRCSRQNATIFSRGSFRVARKKI